MPLQFRRTRREDIGLIRAAESDGDTARWLGDTDEAWHHRALDDPDQEHLLILDGRVPVGFLVLAGFTGRHGSVEIRRVVVFKAHRRRGVGRRAMQLATTRAIAAGAHRVWLDVKQHNRGARALYSGLGFVEEGTLRDAWKEPDGTYSSLVVMSLLREEAARAAGSP
jgi:ribosomal protein S18 acetylase RimI-like enzyme